MSSAGCCRAPRSAVTLRVLVSHGGSFLSIHVVRRRWTIAQGACAPADDPDDTRSPISTRATPSGKDSRAAISATDGLVHAHRADLCPHVVSRPPRRLVGDRAASIGASSGRLTRESVRPSRQRCMAAPGCGFGPTAARPTRSFRSIGRSRVLGGAPPSRLDDAADPLDQHRHLVTDLADVAVPWWPASRGWSRRRRASAADSRSPSRRPTATRSRRRTVATRPSTGWPGRTPRPRAGRRVRSACARWRPSADRRRTPERHGTPRIRRGRTSRPASRANRAASNAEPPRRRHRRRSRPGGDIRARSRPGGDIRRRG